MSESDFIKALRNNEYATIKEKGIKLVIKELDNKDKLINSLKAVIRESMFTIEVFSKEKARLKRTIRKINKTLIANEGGLPMEEYERLIKLTDI